MKLLILSFFALICAFGTVAADPIVKPSLRGVTILSPPFVELDDEGGAFKGFGVDLMKRIADRLGFEYRLYLSPDGTYGTNFIDGKTTGIIGEVENKKADFAIADIVVTDARKRHVAFTEPFFSTQMAVLIHKDDAHNLRTIEDLVNHNARTHGSKITFGILPNGPFYRKLSTSGDEVGKKMFDSIQSNTGQSFVRSSWDGVTRAKNGSFALITYSSIADYVAGLNCKLTVLEDNRHLHPQEFAIPMPRDSHYLEQFNAVIRQMKADGTLEHLKKTYWVNQCNN